MAQPTFADRLLCWWDDHGRKDLPWQHPRTPYRVWISEIMLQQTQVTTVIPYFARWLESFPDIGTLAKASLDDVLGHWSGLGYYARARNIHKAANICRERYGGALPQTAEELAALPGIGLSTANAIVSQSSNRPAAVLDGNVRRVLARHTATEGWTGKAAVQNRLWKEAEARLPDDRGADYTQAVMDLGAMVCKRTQPACAACPVSGDCKALAQGRVDELPSPRPSTKVGARTLDMLIIRDEQGRILLEKRPPAGIWGGLWCLPEQNSLKNLGNTRAIEPLEHRLSHLKLTINPLLAFLPASTQVECNDSHAWFDRSQQLKLGLPRPVSELLKRLDEGEFN